MNLRVGAPTRMRRATPLSSLRVYATTSALAFLGSCLIARGGFVSSTDPGDVGRYHYFADLMRNGALPYRDFYLEYPPGAISAFLLASGGVGYSSYTKIIRKLQLESLGASLLLGLDGASIYVSTIIPGNPGSIDPDGMHPDGVGILTSAHNGLVALLPVRLSVLRDGGGATAAVPQDTEV